MFCDTEKLKTWFLPLKDGLLREIRPLELTHMQRIFSIHKMCVIQEEEEIDSFGWDLGFIPG